MFKIRLFPLLSFLLASQLPLAYAADERGAAIKQDPPKAEAAKPDPSALKPFTEIIRGATRHPGFFPIWTKDDKVWLEIPVEMIDKPFLFQVSRKNGIGEHHINSSSPEFGLPALFHRVGDRMQLILPNSHFYARKSDSEQAIRESFSDSLISNAMVLCQPHPSYKSVLIDANFLLIRDIPGSMIEIEQAMHVNYVIDPSQSQIEHVRADDNISTLHVKADYALARFPVAPPLPAGATPPPMGRPAYNAPDVRNFFLSYVYSFAKLPDSPMPTRHADDRVGSFTTMRQVFGDDTLPHHREYLVDRWRLEKSEPDAPESDAKHPIVFWLDRNIPEKYRKTVQEAIEAWNPAFERIGIKHAIVVKQQGKDDKFDTLEAHRATVRWYLSSEHVPAVGMLQADPRTGEILTATIRIPDDFARNAHREYRDLVKPASSTETQDNEQCMAAEIAAEQLQFGLAELEARGELSQGGEDEEKFVLDAVREVVMHEVGHTLGLRHNFRASTVYTDEQLSDKEFTRTHGIAGSVMDYIPVNLSLKGKPQGEHFMKAIGPYDYWAIAYMYSNFKEEEEKAGLTKLLARASEPELAYGTDEDASANDGSDPDINVWDLGRDTLKFAEKRMALSRELWARLQQERLPDGESYEKLLRILENSIGRYYEATNIAAKYIGGIRHTHDHAGSGRNPLVPVPGNEQRRALKLLVDNVFTADLLNLAPDFKDKLVPDHNDGVYRPLDFNRSVLLLQSHALSMILRDSAGARVVELSSRPDAGKQGLTLTELYGTVQKAIWRDVYVGGTPELRQRNLQMEYVNQLSRSLVRSSNGAPSDSVSLKRDFARELLTRLQTAAARPHLARDVAAHYKDAMIQLREALNANMVRSAG